MLEEEGAIEGKAVVYQRPKILFLVTPGEPEP